MAVTGFDRENLYFEIQRTKEKKERIREYLEKHPGESGIIYCATRKNVDELYLFLESAGFSTGRYHAGMENEARRNSQEDFIYDRIQVMIATNAFGMGIDKSNVRYVLHYNMPQSLENYYQEAGRAGRDSEPAECIIYYSPQDVVINQFLLENKENYGEYTIEEMQNIQAQDRERLQKMITYCTTTGCLRNYILGYFGESGKEPCGNCSNCLEELEEMDAAEAAANIIECVRESGQRFGINMIAGTLLGENTAKIRNYRMNENPCYGKQSKLGQERVKEIIQTMLERGYLFQTKDKYALLKLTDISEELLHRTEPFWVAYRKPEGQKPVKKRRAKAIGDLNEKAQHLFEALRKLRSELAKDRSIPPYMVASDKTLHDMCVKIPLTNEEMLTVNGMGAKKLEQYGEAFLYCIRDITNGDKAAYGAAEMNYDTSEIPLTERTKKGRKEAFHLTEAMEQQIVFVTETTISEFVASINALRDEKTMKRLTIKSITEELLAEGYLEQKFWNGYSRTFLTEKGEALGIRTEERESQSGNLYDVFLYGEKAQRYLVELLRSTAG